MWPIFNITLSVDSIWSNKKVWANVWPYDVAMSSGRYDVVMKVLQFTLQNLLTSAETFDWMVQSIVLNVKAYFNTF